MLAAMVLQVSPRTAQSVLKSVQMSGFVTSDGPKTPVRITFPLDYRERLFPNLFSTEPLDVPAPPEFPRGSRLPRS